MTLTDGQHTPDGPHIPYASRHRPTLDPKERNWQQVTDLLYRLSGLTDIDMEKLLAPHLTRQTFANRRMGFARIRPSDIAPLAEAFGVPETLFDMPVDKVAGWLAVDPRGAHFLVRSFDVPYEQRLRRTGCLNGTAGQTPRKRRRSRPSTGAPPSRKAA